MKLFKMSKQEMVVRKPLQAAEELSENIFNLIKF
jgi:hypothetical protein